MLDYKSKKGERELGNKHSRVREVRQTQSHRSTLGRNRFRVAGQESVGLVEAALKRECRNIT
jgi:hypothetical protein